MKRLLIILLATTSLSVASTWKETNENFNIERINIIKNQYNHDRLVNISQDLDWKLSSKPRPNRYANEQQRRDILTAMAHKSIFGKAFWLEDKPLQPSSSQGNHDQAIKIMQESIEILMKDPFMLLSKSIYKDLGEKLFISFNKQNPYFCEEKVLKILIPHIFLNDLLKMLVNTNHLIKGGYGPVSELEKLSSDALTTLCILNHEKKLPVVLKQKEGFLCLTQKEVDEQNGASLNLIEKNNFSLNKTNDSYNNVYEMRLETAMGAALNQGISIQRIEPTDNENRGLFYAQPDLNTLNEMLRYKYVVRSAIFGSAYEFPLDHGSFLNNQLVLKHIINRFGHLGPLVSMKYYVKYPEYFDRIIPLSIKDAGRLEDVLNHPILQQHGIIDTIKQAFQQLKERSNTQEEKNNCDMYIDICKTGEIEGKTDFKSAYEAWQAKKLKEKQEEQRKREQERVEKRLKEENENVKEIISTIQLPEKNKEYFKDIIDMGLSLLTDKIDIQQWQLSSNKPVEVIDLDTKKIDGIVNKIIEENSFPHTDPKEKINAIQDLKTKILDFYKPLLRDFNDSKRIDNTGPFKNQKAKDLKQLWNAANFNGFFDEVLRKLLPKYSLNLKRLVEEKDNFIKKQAGWGANESIMNVGTFLKKKYNVPVERDIAEVETKDIDDHITLLIKNIKIVDEHDGINDFKDFQALPLFNAIDKDAKTSIAASPHLNQNDYVSKKLSANAIKMRKDFMFVVKNMNLIYGINENSLIIQQFNAYLMDQIGRCCTGLKSRLFLAKLDMASWLEEYYLQKK